MYYACKCIVHIWHMRACFPRYTLHRYICKQPPKSIGSLNRKHGGTLIQPSGVSKVSKKHIHFAAMNGTHLLAGYDWIIVSDLEWPWTTKPMNDASSWSHQIFTWTGCNTLSTTWAVQGPKDPLLEYHNWSIDDWPMDLWREAVNPPIWPCVKWYFLNGN